MTPDELKAWRAARRKAFVEWRLGLDRAEREGLEAALLAHVAPTLEALPVGAVIGFCWPYKGEPDCRALVERALARGGRAVLPVVVAPKSPLAFREWRPGMALAVDHHGIPVPAAGAEELAPDLVLLPMNGFDARGFRLGYGGGYFDRTLAALERRPTVIGLCYERGRLDSIHPQPHDIALDFVATEAGLFAPS